MLKQIVQPFLKKTPNPDIVRFPYLHKDKHLRMTTLETQCDFFKSKQVFSPLFFFYYNSKENHKFYSFLSWM